MDTGNYMVNQMSDLIENSQNIQDEFNEWLNKAIKIYCKDKKVKPRDVIPSLKMPHAKLCFMDGMLIEEYLKTSWRCGSIKQ